MSEKRIFYFVHATARKLAAEACLTSPDGFECRIEPPRRNHEQNAKLWAMLTDISAQVDWYGKKLSTEDWKHVFSSALKKMQVVPNFDGTGFVALGLSTSKMSKSEFAELIELIYAFGSERNVVWSD